MTRPVAPQHMVTRFAPSPTGRLHVGHGWSALMAMDLARGAGGTMRLRIEDIDGTRSRPEHVAGIIEDLRWLGVEWDGDILFQSQRIRLYMAALDRLRDMGLLYPCFCTRADIQASLTAPHGPEGPVYPGTCRALGAEEQTHRIAAGKAHAWRIDMAQATARAGPLCWHAFGAEGSEVIAANPAVHGDVVLARKDAPASYHLSCTLDDAAMGSHLSVLATALGQPDRLTPGSPNPLPFTSTSSTFTSTASTATSTASTSTASTSTSTAAGP